MQPSLGFDEFILSRYPRLEEAFRRRVLRILRQKGAA
jgi:hypothetical protein